jgi:hypothetical protein
VGGQTPSDYNATAKPSEISSEFGSFITMDEKTRFLLLQKEPTKMIRGNPGSMFKKLTETKKLAPSDPSGF